MNQHENDNDNDNNMAASPYRSPPVVADVVAAEVMPTKEVRVWSALTVPVIAILASLVAATVVFVIALFAIVGQPDPNGMEQALSEVIDHPLGIWAMVLPGQLMFFAAAVAAALLSPIPIGKRLRLGRGRLPTWTWLLFMIATPCVGFTMSMLIETLGIEPSAHLEMLEGMMTSQTGFALLACVFLVAVLPGLCEEILFRGYMQGRLLRRWSPVAAIFLSSLLFAIAHVDPLHICAVFPTGVWLGVIAYRAESIWPSILCHFTNNFLALMASQLGMETLGFGYAELMVLIPCSIAMLASLYFLFQDRQSPVNDEAVLL